jgi:hypothetical protein
MPQLWLTIPANRAFPPGTGINMQGSPGVSSVIIDFSGATIEIINDRQDAAWFIFGPMTTQYSSFNNQGQSVTRHPRGWCWLALFLALGWTGCKHESPAAAGINPAGTYTLVSVDGKQVPCNLTHEGAAMTVKSGVFTISGDGTCLSESVFAVESYPDVHREVKATYTMEGTKLTVKWQGAGTTTGTVNGNTFTMNNEGMMFLYQK